MCKWNYLSFDEEFGEPDPQNAVPKQGAFVWAFCGQDHVVMIGYKEPGYGIAWVTPQGLDDDAFIIAWANITEPPTWPDFDEFRRRGTLHPPMESLEKEIERLQYWRESFMEAGAKPTKDQLERKARAIQYSEERIQALQREDATVIENGYHLPPLAKRVRDRRRFAILASTPYLTASQ